MYTGFKRLLKFAILKPRQLALATQRWSCHPLSVSLVFAGSKEESKWANAEHAAWGKPGEGRWLWVLFCAFLFMSKMTSENWTMYQSAEFITEVISETESLDTSDPEFPLMFPWKSYKDHFHWWQRSIQHTIDAGPAIETRKIKM